MIDSIGMEASLRKDQEIRRQSAVFLSNKKRIGDVMYILHARKQRREETKHWGEKFVRNPIEKEEELLEWCKKQRFWQMIATWRESVRQESQAVLQYRATK